MKKGFKIWNIIYPIGIYYAVSSLVYYLLEGFIGTADETYMLRQMICSAATIPFIYRCFRDDKRRQAKAGKTPPALDKQELLKNAGIAAVLMAALGIAVNNVLAMTPLVDMSDGFSEANTSFFAGTVIFELLGSCLIIPIAEELMFRGVMYPRIKELLTDDSLEKEYEFSVVTLPAIVISAVFFGIVHANLVQLIYAAALGLVLAFLLEKTNFLPICMIGHIAANVIAVLRENTGFLAFGYKAGAAGIVLTAVMFGIAGALLYYLIKEYLQKRDH